MTKDSALRLALEALEYTGLRWPQVEEAITAIKAELEAKDEPKRCTPNCEALLQKVVTQRKPLFDEDTQRALDIYENASKPVIDESAAKRIATALGWEPKRTWIGLTDEEIHQIFIANSVAVDNGNAYMVAGLRTVNITRAIEAKLKEKNT